MLITKKIDLGEYIVTIEYETLTGSIEVSLLDETEGLIEYLSVSNSQINDDKQDEDEDIGFNDFNINSN